MDLQYLRRLLKIVDESGIEEFILEEDSTKLHVIRSRNIPPASATMPIPLPVAPLPTLPPTTMLPAEGLPPVASETPMPDGIGVHTLRSPIVGTFYRAASPEAEAFVTVGQTVTAGATVCIIEAMKIMNEIEADVSGKIVRILVENGQAVEYNQPLFLIHTA